MSDNFQILSLDGGGVKGVFTAAVLTVIEEDLNVRVADHFDLIAGTSTGGIIAIGLGLGLRPAEILNFYETYGPKIFKNYFGWTVLDWVFRSKYPQDALKTSLRSADVFSDRLFGSSSKRLVIPSYSLTKDQPYLFRTPHCEHLRQDWKIEAWKVALATSAAPTYFPVCQEINGIRHIDGGIWANNPTMVGITEAYRFLNMPLDRISVFNICPLSDVRNRPKWLSSAGIAQWAFSGHITDVIMRAQSTGVFNQSINLLSQDQVFRVDPCVQGKVFSLDSAESIHEIAAIGREVARHLVPDLKTRFFGHLAAPYEPIHAKEIRN